MADFIECKVTISDTETKSNYERLFMCCLAKLNEHVFQIICQKGYIGIFFLRDGNEIL